MPAVTPGEFDPMAALTPPDQEETVPMPSPVGDMPVPATPPTTGAASSSAAVAGTQPQNAPAAPPGRGRGTCHQ